MRKLLVGLVVMLGLGMLVPIACAETVWSEDFSDVSDWGIISDPGAGSTITASGGSGAMYVDKGKNLAAFGPNTTDANLISFIPTKRSEYTIKWRVNDLTWSVSWDVAIDVFDANKQYLDTVWNIYPSMGSTAEKGEFSKNLGEKTWNIYTRYIKPKINIHTGEPAQTVYFDYIKVEQTPKR